MSILKIKNLRVAIKELQKEATFTSDQLKFAEDDISIEYDLHNQAEDFYTIHLGEDKVYVSLSMVKKLKKFLINYSFPE